MNLSPELIKEITQTVLAVWQNQIQDPIILWKHPTLENAFTLLIGGQRKIGFVRTDQKGQNYWKFHWWEESKALKKELKENESNPKAK